MRYSKEPMKMSRMAAVFFLSRGSAWLSAVVLCTVLAACGGGSSSPALTVVAEKTQTIAGGPSVTLTATKNLLSGAVTWSLALGSPGTLDASSGDSIHYIPPAPGSISSDTQVTVIAAVGGLTQSVTFTLHPSP
jgi:hypothetical protein